MNTTTTDQAVVPAQTRLQCLKPAEVAAKCGRKPFWIWSILKNDPSFPRPTYLGNHAPVFFEHEIEAWLLAQAAKRGAA